MFSEIRRLIDDVRKAASYKIPTDDELEQHDRVIEPPIREDHDVGEQVQASAPHSASREPEDPDSPLLKKIFESPEDSAERISHPSESPEKGPDDPYHSFVKTLPDNIQRIRLDDLTEDSMVQASGLEDEATDSTSIGSELATSGNAQDSVETSAVFEDPVVARPQVKMLLNRHGTLTASDLLREIRRITQHIRLTD